MPYISTDRVKEVRNELKATFPAITFSITCVHYSTIRIAIMESPFKWESDYICFNPFYLENYEHADLLQQIKEIANAGNGTLCEDGDYGTIPRFYLDIQIGKWDRPHKTIPGN